MYDVLKKLFMYVILLNASMLKNMLVYNLIYMSTYHFEKNCKFNNIKMFFLLNSCLVNRLVISYNMLKKIEKNSVDGIKYQ